MGWMAVNYACRTLRLAAIVCSLPQLARAPPGYAILPEHVVKRRTFSLAMVSTDPLSTLPRDEQGEWWVGRIDACSPGSGQSAPLAP